MKRLAVAAAIVTVSTVAMVTPARAGSSTDAALALGSFAVLNQLVHGQTVLHDIFVGPRPPVVRETVIVQRPPAVVYAPPPPVYYAPAPPVYYAPAPPPVVYHSAPAAVLFSPYYRHIPPGHLKHHWKYESWR